MAAKDSTTEFAVVCANNSLQRASIDPNLSVTMRRLLKYSAANSYNDTIITSGPQLRIVTYTGEGKVQLYTVGNLSPETLQLPSNINCTSHPTLHPLHTRDAFLLHCMTESGAVLYVVPVPVSADVAAQSVPADGLPYSSQDGTHILVVDGPQVTIYSSADTSATGTVKRLPSEITSVVNLDSDNVRLLTETGEHAVMNLKNSLSEPRYMPGGPPVLSEWVDSSNHYLYITKSSTLYVVNETSTQPQYEPREIANTPEMMLFLEGVNSATDKDDSNLLNITTLLGNIIAFLLLLIFWAIAIPILVCVCTLGKCSITKCCKSCRSRVKKKPPQQTSQSPSQEADGSGGGSDSPATRDHEAYQMDKPPTEIADEKSDID